VTCVVMVVRAFERGVETARKHVLLDLAVPLIGHKLFEPLRKTSKLGSRKAGHNGFKFFNAHGRRLRSIPTRGKKKTSETRWRCVISMPTESIAL